MTIKPALTAIAAAILIVGLSGCGSSATTATSTTTAMASPSMSATHTAPGAAASASPSAGRAVQITIKDYKFTVPASVAPGAKVMVKNLDAVNHTFTSVTAGAFNVTAVAGATETFTAPSKLGSYMFKCMFHANMTGALVVK